MGNLVNTAKVAQLYGVSEWTVREWYRAGKIRAVKCGHRTLRYDLDEVIEDLKYASKISRVRTNGTTQKDRA